MTIDERLDRLAERHEALTQHFGLMQHDWQERWGRIQQVMTALAEAQFRTEDTMTRLGNIVIGHEQPLERLEGQ
jgi:hypothetical protein